MSVIQGDFDSAEAAEHAIALLEESGIPAERIRRWSILPPGLSSTSGDESAVSGAARGAMVGGLLGGLVAGAPGFAAGAIGGMTRGAAAGSARESATGDAPSPDPAGVRVAVDVRDGDPNVADILRKAGAKAILTI